jgi:hypothetical protein
VPLLAWKPPTSSRGSEALQASRTSASNFLFFERLSREQLALNSTCDQTLLSGGARCQCLACEAKGLLGLGRLAQTAASEIARAAAFAAELLEDLFD